MVKFLPQNKDLCALEISAEGVAVACLSNIRREITTCSFYPCQNENQLKECIMDMVLQKNLKKTNCYWILHPSQYHLTLINTPNVPPFEYKNASRWQIKDIINYPLEDASVDVFAPDELEKRPKKIYIVAAQNSFLQNTADILQDCFLHPTVIDIREFAIRNLLSSAAPENEPVGLLDFSADSCLLVTVQQKRIRFVRRTPFGSQKLKSGTHNELATELRRSLNYCATELKQKVPTKFFVSPASDIDINMMHDMAKNLEKEIAKLELQKVARFATPIALETEMRCWAAVGGVLRQ